MNYYTRKKRLLIKLFFISLCVFIITDTIWIGFIAKDLYIKQYAQWLRLVDGEFNPILWATLIVYLLLASSIVTFILPLAQKSLLYSAIYGAWLGAIIYGVYDFTCLSVFKDFPTSMAFIDWAWGTTLFSFTSLITNLFFKYLK